MPGSSKGSTFYSGEVSPEIIRQMPSGIEPGSLLHSLRYPYSYILWTIAESMGLENSPKIQKAFYEHINNKHFGNGQK